MLIHNEFEGIITLSAFKIDKDGEEIPGTRRNLTPFKNLITDLGLNRMGANLTSGGYLSWFQVGSGNTPPTINDTALVNRIASTNNTQATSFGSQSTAPYYTWRRITRRFATGVAAGNLSEIGIGWESTGSLFSRALIRDALGNPTTITILPDESLDVTYELRCYPKTTDSTGTITATGNISGVYSYIMRAESVTSSENISGWHIGSIGTFMSETSGNISFNRAYTGSIGAITSSPAGTQAAITSFTTLPYSTGSFSRTFRLNFGLNDGNIAIRSLSMKAGIGRYQCEITPVLTKTSASELYFEFTHSWGRRP
jgi:hypothetical protein